jgi:hypothetical protein
MSTSVHQEGLAHKGDVEVTVRTPAGASHRFRLGLNELVIRALATAVAYFVEKGEIEAGDYALELIRNGQPTALADTGRLGDYGLRDDDQLHLISEKPQVDG